MINLRRPTEAVLQPGQVQEVHLADAAVDLGGVKVTGLLPNGKLAVIGDVTKIQDDLLTLAKMNDDVKVNPWVGGEVEQSVLGDTEAAIIETGFIRLPTRFVPNKLRVVASLKVDPSPETAYLKVYVDDEVAERMLMESTETDYELVDAEADISDLSAGRHKLTVKAYTTDPAATAWSDYVDILFVKG